MKTIVVFNQKGGVGKTSTVINLMAEFSAKGYKVLGIDLDAQCNLSAFYKIREPKASVHDWLLKQSTLNQVVVSTLYGDIIPAAEVLQVDILNFAAIPAFVFRIRELLTAIPTGQYDIVIIDCPPAVNQLTAAALTATDYVLIPTEAEFFSADGVGRIAETISQVKPINPNLQVLGILLVKYNARRNLTKALEDKLSSATEQLLDSAVLDTHIRFTVDVPSVQASGCSVREYKATSGAGADYFNLTNEIEKIIFER